MSQPTHLLVAVQTVTPACTLRAAARYLAAHGWVQGCYYDPSATVFTPAACLVGAVGMVCYGGPVDAPALNHDHPGWQDFEDALTHLDAYLSGRYGTDVYEFNDAKGRTVEDVRAVTTEAADAWELLNVSCPECSEPAYSRPPTDWHMPRCWPIPAYSHRDGTPLCPVYGPNGVVLALPRLVEGGG